MARQFTRSRGRLGTRRETSWFPIDFVFSGVGVAGVILNSLTTTEKAKRPFTILRTHLEVRMASDQIVASEVQLAGIGLAVVSDQASGIGISAVPTPVTDLGSDLWFVHQVLFGSFLFGDATGFQEPVGTFASIDSKAMRKVNDAEDVVIVAESSAIGQGLTITSGGRLLIKEH